MRRDRAARHGPELFLLERTFQDCLERLSFVAREFSSVLLIGCPDPTWARVLGPSVTVVEPGPLFAEAAGVAPIAEDSWMPRPGSFDLCVAVGTLDTVDDLPRALLTIRAALRPDSLLIGAIAGGDSLPRLRQAMHAADRLAGAASPHVHPRIDAPSLVGLLGAAGFAMPVVDIDRVEVRYRSLAALVRDLRRMGATNILTQRLRRPISKAQLAAAEAAFAPSDELFEILHFAAWTPAA